MLIQFILPHLRTIISLILIAISPYSKAQQAPWQVYYVDVLVKNDTFLNCLSKFEDVIESEKYDNPYIYNANINNPLTIDEFVQKIESMDSINIVKTDLIRIYFKTSSNFHQLLPIAFARCFSIDATETNGFTKTTTNSIIEPMFVAPIARFKKLIPNKDYNLLCQKTSELLINAISYLHFENGNIATNTPVSAGHPLFDFEVFNNNSVLDFTSKNDFYKLKYTAVPHDDDNPLNQKDIEKLITTKDSILTTSGNISHITNNSFSDILFSFYPQISIEMADDQYGYKYYAKISLTSDYIGFCTAQNDNTNKNCFWTKKNELFPVINNPAFIEGLDFFESQSIQKQILKN
jgi:hypothetical protein